jgi:hypothetical protein
MRTTAFLALLVLAGCAGQGEMIWHKEGAPPADTNTALYECERDTRMSAASFSGGIQGAGEAQAFMGRCMNARGYYPVSASTLGPRRAVTYSRGVAYDADARVMCQVGAGPVPMLAGACVNGGGTIIGRAS